MPRRRISDRQFRFDYLDRRIRAENRLSAFAYRAEDVPAEMTRLQAVVDFGPGGGCAAAGDGQRPGGGAGRDLTTRRWLRCRAN